MLPKYGEEGWSGFIKHFYSKVSPEQFHHLHYRLYESGVACKPFNVPFSLRERPAPPFLTSCNFELKTKGTEQYLEQWGARSEPLYRSFGI